MSRYTLRSDGYATFKKIYLNRKWIGRVCPHADGGFVGTIGKVTLRAPTEHGAFEAVVADHAGFSSGPAMRQASAVASARRRHAARAGRAAAREFLAATTFEDRWAALDKIFGPAPKKGGA